MAVVEQSNTDRIICNQTRLNILTVAEKYIIEENYFWSSVTMVRFFLILLKESVTTLTV